MITFVRYKNIFESQCQTLVCPVNTAGTLGNGLAAQFKYEYPGLLEAYREACNNGSLVADGLFVYTVSPTRKILCMPTKRHWRFPSKLEWIEDGLKAIELLYLQHDITSLAIPAVGCGKGHLEWRDVRPLIVKYFKDSTLRVVVFEP